MRSGSLETNPPAGRAGAFRLLIVGGHLAWGLAAATLIYPFCPRSARLALRRLWAGSVLDALGLDVRVEGVAIVPGALLVANHVSWLDVLVLACRTPAVFVAKQEVRRWPMIGWLAARAGTLFLRRASGRSLLEVKQSIAELLCAGRSVALFPEATTTDGAGVLPFRSGLLQASVESGRPVQPIALAYCDERGGRSAAAAFIDGMTLWQSLAAISGSERITACVAVAPPLALAGRTRKQLAREAREAVAAALAQRN
jgi:1-acyl-sn-glycerol-3-phosphate acyltransferase